MRPALAALLLFSLAACGGTRPYANLGVGVGGGDVRLSPSLTVSGRYAGVSIYR